MKATASERSRAASVLSITDREFGLFQRLMYDEAGVTLSAAKKALVCGRLSKRLLATGCGDFSSYHALVAADREERQRAVDLLTTNETYFFREPKHFDFVRSTVLAERSRGRSLRVWSAACSSGEEVYSIAMLLADELGPTAAWTVMGSDLNREVIARGRVGHYGMARTDGVPKHYLRQFCLKGTGRQTGTFLINKNLREKVSFCQINLNARLPQMDPFDLVFLRNVMIYFSPETKSQVVRRIVDTIRPGGYLLIGHSESLHGMEHGLQQIKPSIYRKRL